MTELQKQSFCEFFNFFENTYFIEHLRWLLLELIKPISNTRPNPFSWEYIW